MLQGHLSCSLTLKVETNVKPPLTLTLYPSTLISLTFLLVSEIWGRTVLLQAVTYGFFSQDEAKTSFLKCAKRIIKYADILARLPKLITLDESQ